VASCVEASSHHRHGDTAPWLQRLAANTDEYGAQGCRRIDGTAARAAVWKRGRCSINCVFYGPKKRDNQDEDYSSKLVSIWNI
jgi:hypothetical protein